MIDKVTNNKMYYCTLLFIFKIFFQKVGKYTKNYRITSLENPELCSFCALVIVT